VTQAFFTVPVLSLVILAQPTATYAVSLCSAPLRPSCIDMDSTYGNEVSVTRCKQDLKRFMDDAENYVQCLEMAIEETHQEMKNIRIEFEEKTQEK